MHNLDRVFKSYNAYNNLYHSSSNWIKGSEIMYDLENDIYPIEIDDQIISFVQTNSKPNTNTKFTSCIKWDHYSIITD